MSKEIEQQQREVVLRKDIQEGINAQQIVENETFKMVIESLNTKYLEAWEQTPDKDTQHELWLARNALKAVVGTFQIVIDDGKIAESEIQKQQDSEEKEEK